MAVTLIGDRSAPPLQGRCTVVSEGGLGATLTGNVPLGDIVSLDLYFPDTRDTVRAWATVKDSRSPNFGMEFFSLGEGQRAVIKHFCSLHHRPPRPVFIEVLRKYLFASKH
jgi:hypothetical protein